MTPCRLKKQKNNKINSFFSTFTINALIKMLPKTDKKTHRVDQVSTFILDHFLVNWLMLRKAFQCAARNVHLAFPSLHPPFPAKDRVSP